MTSLLFAQVKKKKIGSKWELETRFRYETKIKSKNLYNCIDKFQFHLIMNVTINYENLYE